MKEFSKDREVTKEDVKYFMFNAHFYIIGSILILGVATLVQAPIWVSIIFGLYGIYRLILLGIFVKTKQDAWEQNMSVEEYINTMKKKEY